jgi:hypothetical protein
MDLVYFLVVALGNCAESYHKSFLDKYFEPLKDAVQNKILNADEKQLRAMMRERTEEIVKTLWEKLMARLMTFFDSQVHKQILNINIGVLYLRQKFLERRIDGALEKYDFRRWTETKKGMWKIKTMPAKSSEMKTKSKRRSQVRRQSQQTAERGLKNDIESRNWICRDEVVRKGMFYSK